MIPPRKLSFQVQLGQGSFGEDGFDTVEVAGLRASVDIDKSGGAGLNTMNARIWGLRQSVMNKLSIVGNQLIDGRNNLITVKAGDGDVMSVAFVGVISQAWGNYQGAPDVPFVISAAPTLFDALKPIPPSSYQGASDAAVILSGLAAQMGIAFRNDGVQVKLAPGVYLSGTAPVQARKVAEMANINLVFDEIEGAPGMIIWPGDGVRGGAIPLISKDTGMKGWPAWTQAGIQVQTVYNPEISYGAQIEVQSKIEPASGNWSVFKLQHNLEAEIPDGQWFTTLECSKFGVPLPIGGK